MVAREKDIIGGFDVFKAAQRAAREKTGAPNRPEESTGAAPEGPAAAPRIGSHIGRTVLPTKHHVMCYECSYEFTVTGKVKSTFCPKCRTNLTFQDVSVDAEHAGDLKTAGTIRIGPEGVVREGEIFANFIVLEGAVEGGSLFAFRELTLGPDARFDLASVQARDLKIAAGATYQFDECRYHHIDVHGELTAHVQATGTVTVRASGCIRGEVNGAHLVVEEGGGLLAQLHIDPALDSSKPAKSAGKQRAP